MKIIGIAIMFLTLDVYSMDSIRAQDEMIKLQKEFKQKSEENKKKKEEILAKFKKMRMLKSKQEKHEKK